MGKIDLRHNLSLTPTITATTYSAGQVIGGLLTWTAALDGNNPHGEVRSVFVYDSDKQGKNLVLYLFRAIPSTVTDTTTFDPSAADLVKICGVVPITTHYAFTTRGISYAENQAVSVWSTSPSLSAIGENIGNLYGYLVATETPAYSTTSSLTIRPVIIQD